MKDVGPYLAGVVTVAGYLLAIGALVTAGGLRDFTESPGAALVAFVVCSVLFGSIIGHQLLRPGALEPIPPAT